MKRITALITLCTMAHCFGRAAAPGRSTAAASMDTSSHRVIYLEDFNDNKRRWEVTENKYERTRIDSGYYYLTALHHPYGAADEVKIDTHKDFEIEARIRILGGHADHKNYYSMLFWGRKGGNGYYLTFAKDGFVFVERCEGMHQRNCTTMKGSLQKSGLSPGGFNIYTIKKRGHQYSFFVNGIKFYEMPFVPFFGNLVGFGAGRKISLAVDYLKVAYL